MNWTLLSSVSALVSFLASLTVFHKTWTITKDGDNDWISAVVAYLAAYIFLILSLVLLHIAYLRPARSHSLLSLLRHYWQHTSAVRKLSKSGKEFETLLRNTTKVQESLLLKFLRKNQNTVYGKDHGFASMHSVADFRRNHPLTVYKHYESYVDRTLEGEQNVMFPEVVDYYITTSGTTSSKSKVIPRNMASIDKTGNVIADIIGGKKLACPGMNTLKYQHVIRFVVAPREIAPGVLRGPNTSVYKPPPFSVSPLSVYRMDNEQRAFYIHAFLGLKERDIKCFQFVTTTIALNFFRAIEENWVQLCDDIERGCISGTLGITDALREELTSGVRPDPVRANELRAGMRKGFNNILGRLWPTCKVIFAIATGTFHTSTKLLRKYYVGDVAIYSTVHAASEGLYGLSFKPSTTDTDMEYLIIPSLNFYEFILEEACDEDDPTAVLATEVEVGKVYEIVVTVENGMYRYRTGDLVKITGFEGTCPKYQFIQRSGEFIMANTLKYPECVFTEAMLAAGREWKGTMYHYMATENINVDNIFKKASATSFYYIFVELEGDATFTESEKRTIHENLVRYERYEWDTRVGRVAPPVVLQVTKGTFDAVKELVLSKNPDASAGQYKGVKFTRREDILKLLIQRSTELEE